MRYAFLITACALACAACMAGDAAKPPPASASSPAVDAKEVAAIVAQLGSDKYDRRQEARKNLMRIADLPGVADILRERLKTTTDAEVKAALEEIVADRDKPLVLVWPGGFIKCGMPAMSAPAPGSMPWLFIRGDGTFFYDMSCPLFVERASTNLDFRQGVLGAKQLLALKEKIEASNVLDFPSVEEPMPEFKGPEGLWLGTSVSFRGGSRKHSSRHFLKPRDLAPTAKLPKETPAEITLLAAVRDMIAAAPSVPPQEPLALTAIQPGGGGAMAAILPATQPVKPGTLPEWTLKQKYWPYAIALLPRAIDKKDLPELRQALEKGPRFTISHQVWEFKLVPDMPDAREAAMGKEEKPKR